MLWLDHSSTFTGKVADFGAQESMSRRPTTMVAR